MKVFALQGNKNYGKSITIKKFAILLMKNRGIASGKDYKKHCSVTLKDIERRVKIEESKMISAKISGKQVVRNIRIILNINNKKVGICSAGDSADELVWAIEAFKKENCCIGVVAVHSDSTKDAGLTYLQQISTWNKCSSCDVEYIKKSINSSNIIATNNLDADNMLKKINPLI